MPSFCDRDFIECGLPSIAASMTSMATSTSASVPCRPDLWKTVSNAIAALRTPFESNNCFELERRCCVEPPTDTFSLVTVTPCSLDHKKAANHTRTGVDLKNRTVRYAAQRRKRRSFEYRKCEKLRRKRSGTATTA